MIYEYHKVPTPDSQPANQTDPRCSHLSNARLHFPYGVSHTFWASQRYDKLFSRALLISLHLCESNTKNVKNIYMHREMERVNGISHNTNKPVKPQSYGWWSYSVQIKNAGLGPFKPSLNKFDWMNGLEKKSERERAGREREKARRLKHIRMQYSHLFVVNIKYEWWIDFDVV